MINSVYNFIDNIPHTLLVGIVFIVGYILIRLGVPLYYNVKNSILRRYNHDKEIFHNGTSYMLSNAQHDLFQILEKCFNKGGKTINDIKDYGEVRYHYRKLEGNKVLDMIDDEFSKIPLITCVEIPLELGNKNPDKETIKIMANIYKKLNNGVLPQEEIKDPINVIKKK